MLPWKNLHLRYFPQWSSGLSSRIRALQQISRHRPAKLTRCVRGILSIHILKYKFYFALSNVSIRSAFSSAERPFRQVLLQVLGSNPGVIYHVHSESAALGMLTRINFRWLAGFVPWNSSTSWVLGLLSSVILTDVLTKWLKFVGLTIWHEFKHELR